MAEQLVRIGQTVELTDKNLVGKVAYIGTTQFAAGKWIGVVLDEPKGKNNGSVQGRSYFKCPENCGLFVRQANLKVLDDVDAAPPIERRVPVVQRQSSGIRPPSSSAVAAPTTPATSDRNSGDSETLETPKVSSSNAMSASTPATLPQLPALAPTLIPMTQIKAFTRVPSALGQSSAAAQQEKLLQTAANEEIEKLQAEVKDLNEKLDTLKIKRAEDKAKLKEFEKSKIQIQQLMENKRQMADSHSDLQKQLAAAKKEAKDAVEAHLQHAEDMQELQETAEMATLDKEMAEEKYEQLKAELEAAKEKLEETQVDFELLKSEIEEKGGSVVADSFELKQLETQNEKLKEAVIKLRDLSAQDKLEIVKLSKELEKSKTDFNETQKGTNKLTKLVSELEAEIVELKEQVDLALGAQEMVEILTDKNLELEDQIAQLEDDKDVLENLIETNEQLLESARETEQELLEELDLTKCQFNEANRRNDNSQEALADYEKTIHKFRDLVTQLKAENDELREASDASVSQQTRQVALEQEQAIGNEEFKLRFQEAKATARAVELELRRLEATQATQRVELLSKFLPDAFFTRGSDADAIDLLLFVPRVLEKCSIISRQVIENYPIKPDFEQHLTSEVLIREPEIIRAQAFSRKTRFLLVSLQTTLNQYTTVLDTCPPDLYLKLGGLLPELGVHETTINNYLELLKSNKFDDTVSLEPMEKALSYFQSLFAVHLAEPSSVSTSNAYSNSIPLLNDFVSIMTAGSSAIVLDRHVMETSITPSEKLSSNLLANMFNYLEDIQQFCKKIKRKVASEHQLKVPPAVENEINDSIVQLAKTLTATSSMRCAVLSAVGEPDAEKEALLTGSKIEQIAANVGGFKFIEDSLSSIMSICSQLSTNLQQGDYDVDILKSPQKTSINRSPVDIRADLMKTQAAQLDELKSAVVTKENENSELKRALKVKIDEASEMCIRKDIAEKKLQNANKDADERVARLQSELDGLKAHTRKKEKEFEETMNHLQKDIDALESERGELKDRVKHLSKKTMYEGLAKSVTSAGSPLSTSSVGSSPGLGSVMTASMSSPSLSMSESGYVQQIAILRKVLAQIRDENYNLKMKSAVTDLGLKPLTRTPRFKPMWLLRAQGDHAKVDPIQAQHIELVKKSEAIQRELRRAAVGTVLFDLSRPIQVQVKEQALKKQTLLSEARAVERQLVEFIKSNASELFVSSDLNKFTAPELKSALAERLEPKLAARVHLPCSLQQAKTIPIEVSTAQLHKLHMSMA